LSESESSAPEDDLPKSVPTRCGWLSRFIKNIRWRAYWRFPNVVSPPYGVNKHNDEQRDRESNETSRVPEDEELRLRVVWGVELYGPAEAENLCAQLSRLNWSAGIARSVDDSAGNWVRYQRAHSGAGAWYNVGLVTSQGDQSRFIKTNNNYAQMPECVDCLHVCIRQLTPSLTCVLIGFVLKGCIVQGYEEALNQDRKTRYERLETQRGVSILDPQSLKQRSIERIRDKARTIVQAWFSKNIPGFFCSLSNTPIPIAEFITTKNNHLLPNSDEQKLKARCDWRSLVATSLGYDVWTSSACNGLRFLIDNSGWKKKPPHFVVALCRSDIADDFFDSWGGNVDRDYLIYSHDHIEGVLSNYAVTEFLKAVSSDLKISRAALTIKNSGRRKAIRTIEKIQAFFDHSLGTPAIVAELLEHSKHLGNFKYRCQAFLSPVWGKDDEQCEFSATLCEQTSFLAKQVINEERSLREHFEQLSTVLSVRESVQAQRRMEWLTVMAVVIATASLLVTLHPAGDWLETSSTFLHRVQGYFESLWSAIFNSMEP